jgi:hypothetical protein
VAVFDGTLDAGRTRYAAQPSTHLPAGATFDALARVRRYLGANDEIAELLLENVRAAWARPA